MRCFVAGGTGVVGRRVVPLLVEAGHDVTVLARRPENDEAIVDLGATPARADLFDASSLVSAVAGHEAVINLATHIPTFRQAARRRAWLENDRIRTEGVANLFDAAVRSGVDRFIQESIVFPYEEAGDSWIDEQHARTSSGSGEAVGRAEGCVEQFARAGGVGVVLRFAQFYAADSNHTRAHAAMFRRGINPLFGPPDAYVALIGVPAAARAVVCALGAPSGVYNVVDDDPPTRRIVGSAVQQLVGGRAPRTIPNALLRRINPASEMMMRSQRISNRALRAATGWVPDDSGAAGFARVIDEIVH